MRISTGSKKCVILLLGDKGKRMTVPVLIFSNGKVYGFLPEDFLENYNEILDQISAVYLGLTVL